MAASKMMQISLEERILKAAQDLFFEKGYYATTTRELATQAGTSESGIFRVFGSKYAVLMAVYNYSWGKVNEVIENTVEFKDDPRYCLLEIFRTVFELYEKKKKLMSFIIINTGNTDTLIVARQEKAIISDENIRYIERIEEFCSKSVKEGFLPVNVSARMLTEGLLGISEGILLGWYLADFTDNTYPNKVTIEESLDFISNILSNMK